MPQIEWYYARGNKQMGPVSSVELKRLATVSELRPDDLVWREGLTEWASARGVRGLFDEEGPPTGVDQSASKAVVPLGKETEPAKRATALVAEPIAAARHPIDVLLDSLRSDFNARFVETTARLFRTCGLYGLLVAMAFVGVYAILLAVHRDALNNLLSGAMVLLLLAALQYTAGRFCDALDRLNRATAGTLASTALPDGVAALSLVGGLIVLFGSVPMAVDASMYPLILMGIAGFFVCGYLAFVALNPSTLAITIASDAESPSAEAIGVLTFVLKALMRVAPVALGTGAIAGTLLLGYACYVGVFHGDNLSAVMPVAAVACLILIASAALPLAAYLLFLFYHLLLDLCRSILSMPDKLDQFPGKDEET